jgi:uncharacterized protein YggE
MKPTIFFVASLLLGTLGAQAQQMGNAVYGQGRGGQQRAVSAGDRSALTSAQPGEDQLITLRINGLANIAPTSFVAVFNLIQVGTTPETATGLMRERIRAFTRSLAGLGIDSTRLRLDVISFVPRYELQAEKRVFSKRFNEVPTGYELQQTLSVLYHNDALAPAILRSAALAEITDLVKVDVSVADPHKPAEQLREQCLQALKARERAYVAAGFRLDTLLRRPTETSATAYPVSRYASYQAAARPSLEAARASRSLLGGQPTITEAPQTTAYYYNPVAPDQYDVVVNPTVTGPVIQYSYSLTVQYVPRPVKARKTYFLINGAGEAHPLPLEP